MKKLDNSQIIESLSRLTLDWVLEDGFLKIFQLKALIML